MNFMDKDQEIKLHERVACLEMSIKGVEQDMTAIKTNHLPHIQAGVDNVSGQVQEIKNTLSYYAGMGIVAVTVLNIVVSVILKIWK